MSTFVGHALAGVAVTVALRDGIPPERRRVIAALAVVAALLPDADSLLLLVAGSGALAHRGLSHSLLFAAASAAVLTGLCCARGRLPAARVLAILFLAALSHLLLDYLMGAGPPIRPFAPFDERGYLSPIRLVPTAYYATSAAGYRSPAFWGLNAVAAVLEAAIIGPVLLVFDPALRARTRALAATLVAAGVAVAFVLYN